MKRTKLPEQHGAFRAGSGRRAGQSFDARHGVVTEALVFLGQLDPEAIGPSLEFATHYEPVPIGDFTRMLDASPTPPNDATFVDIGCGMGRAVLLAAERPFRQVIGLEISPALCAIARENVTARDCKALRCRDVRIVRGDARTWQPPGGVLVVFLYNPFRSPVMNELAQRLASAPADDVTVIYHTPLARASFEATGAFEPVHEFPFGVILRRTARVN